MVKSINKQVSTDLPRPYQDSSGHYSLLLTPAEKVENLNSWHNFLLVVFTPQTSSCGPERWVSSTMNIQRWVSSTMNIQ